MITEEDVNSCPGLLGDVTRYVYQRLKQKQPGLAFGASLAFMGALMSGRVHSQTGIEPCAYSCVVGLPGIGKSTAQDAVRSIIQLAGLDSQASEFLMGKPASDSGLIKSLSKHPRRLLIWDELGIALGALSKPQGASYQAMLLSTIMDLYSAAGKAIKGKEYATEQRVDSDGAYLSIFGASTPNRFFGSLNMDFVEDGFLARWFLFFAQDETEFKFPHDDSELLESILDRVRAIQDWEVSNPEGDLAQAIPQVVGRVKKMVMIPLPDFENTINNKITKSKNLIEQIFLGRLYEMTTKVCLCMAEEDDGIWVCPPKSEAWARKFVWKMQKEMIAKCQKGIFANQKIKVHNDLLDKFQNLMGPEESLTRSQVFLKTQRWCSSIERRDMVQSLLDSEFWLEIKQESENTYKKTTIYKRLK